MKNILKKSKSIKWLLIGVTIFLVVLFIFFLITWIYDVRYQDRIFPGVNIAGLDLGDKNIRQAKALLQAKVDNLADAGVTFVYQATVYKVLPIVSIDEKASQVYELWSYNIDDMVQQAYNVGRQGNFLQKNMIRLVDVLVGKTIPTNYKLNDKKIVEALKEKFAPYEKPGKQANFVWKNNRILISEEETGQIFDYKLVLYNLAQALSQIKSQKIELKLKIDNPKIIKSKVEFLKGRANDLLKLAPITLRLIIPEYYHGRKQFKTKEWHIKEDQLKEWFEIKLSQEKQPVVGLNHEKVKHYLKGIAAVINTPAQDAKFNVENGKVVEWQSSEDGFTLNLTETLFKLENLVLNNTKTTIIDLVLTVDKSQLTNESVNTMGIKELIAVGESNFRGSPANRRHNIKIGAAALNGLLIAPQEEFSLLNILGDINAASGYLPELVIKEGKTIPEYGGGLCQIGTTAFRLAINAGLPITERRNHSYRVGYYEPAGTDATIYDPWPDLKFINDYQTYLLLQTRTEGNKLIFEFWGTSDGRQVATTTPVIYNIVKPGEPEYIETTELAPGEKRRTEHSHNGADAYFKRIISWPTSTKVIMDKPEREVVEEVWSSHYVPWRERWLVGVEPKQATSTESVISNQ